MRLDACRATLVDNGHQSIDLLRGGGTAIGAGGEACEELVRTLGREGAVVVEDLLAGRDRGCIKRAAEFDLMDADLRDRALFHHGEAVFDDALGFALVLG